LCDNFFFIRMTKRMLYAFIFIDYSLYHVMELYILSNRVNKLNKLKTKPKCTCTCPTICFENTHIYNHFHEID